MNNELTVSYKVEDTEVKLTPSIVKTFITGGADVTLAEFKMFTEVCKCQKLNPFLKEAYCIKYGNQPAQIVISKDVYIKRALLNPDFDGLESGVVVVNSQGKIKYIEGTSYDKDTGKLIGAWARLHRKNWKVPRMLTVSLDECIQRKKDGTPNQMWATRPAMMCEKVAKSRVLKESFVNTVDFNRFIDDSEIEVEPPLIVVEQEEPVMEVVEQEEPVIETVEAQVVADEEEINLDEL